jgi:PhoH-like ATPase
MILVITMNTKTKKIFVLDTNVILHDSSCIYEIKEHDIVIPITVLEELDNFKKGNSSLNFHSREFARAIDSLSGEKLFNGGVTIGKGMGKLNIQLDKKFHENIEFNFGPGKADHHILNTAFILSRDYPKREVNLVSKDVNLRLKAKSIGLSAQDYKRDYVKDVSSLYKGHRRIENVDENVVQNIYQNDEVIDPLTINLEEPLRPNEYLILRNNKISALGTYNLEFDQLKRVDKISAYGIKPRNAEQTFALDALVNVDIPLVSLSGKAGTGKTLLALAAALERKKHYRQIYIARPVVPLSNKDIGYLPGDIKSKLDPYMQPLYDNLAVIQNQFEESDKKHRRIKELLDEEKLVISPLAYIRGRSLVNIFFVVDEAQNLTPHEVKTIITRAGEGTKIVFTGDIFQIDHPYLDSESNGLSYLIEKMHGQPLYAHINLEKGERSVLAELASNLL